MREDRSRAAYDDESAEEPAERRDDEPVTPWFVPWAWPTGYDRDDRRASGTEVYEEYEGEDDGWLDEGLITLTIVAGATLFLFPEPATSALGVLLLGVGVIAWLVDWATEA